MLFAMVLAVVGCALLTLGVYTVVGAQPTLRSLERGMENPTVAVLEGIAAALGVEIEALFARPKAGDEAPGPLPSGRKRREA